MFSPPPGGGIFSGGCSALCDLDSLQARWLIAQSKVHIQSETGHLQGQKQDQRSLTSGRFLPTSSRLRPTNPGLRESEREKQINPRIMSGDTDPSKL